VVMCLGQNADLHMVKLMPLSLTSSCSSNPYRFLPSWFYLSCGLTLVVLDKIQEGRKTVMSVCVCCTCTFDDELW